ncbi:hypothetical protein ACHFJ0_09330 [Paracoccus sp. NGMCC 1.201697]|uniref:Uncharacterized protein n=1 Tax=Paracoccus broussonetiae subsp. drimophilus TaxID=3373869 RepID=A0ABW7LJD2_9RHOB
MVQLLSGSQRGDRPIVPTLAAAHDRLICHRAQDIIGTHDFQAEIETVPVNLRGTRIGHSAFSRPDLRQRKEQDEFPAYGSGK